MSNGKITSTLTTMLVAVILAAVISTTATAQSPYADSVGANNPIAWWRMDDATDSANSHDGLAGAGVAFGQPGGIADPSSQAAAFDRSSDAVITVADAANLNFGKTTDFSVEAWANRPSGLSSQWTAIVNKGDTNGSFWMRYESDGKVRMILDYGATSTSVISPLPYDDGQLHHFVGTVDRNGSAILYVDGQPVAETPIEIAVEGGNISSPTMPMQIGGMGTTHRYDSLMDEFAVYGDALSAGQVKTHYDLGSGAVSGSYSATVTADAPVGWWRMDDASDEMGTHTGAAGSGITFDQPGAIAGDTSMAAAFDNISEIAIDDAADLNFGTDEDFTIETWVKHSGGFTPITNKGDSAASYWLRFESDGTIRLLLDYGSTSSAVRSADAYDDDQWHHVVAVADRDTALQLYVDGELVAQKDLLESDVSSPGMDLQIGKMGTSHPMNGLLDEVALYDSVLSAADVLAHYEAGSVPEPSSLILLFAGVFALLALGRNRK